MSLEVGNKEINGHMFPRRTQLYVFEENVALVNVASRIKVVSQTQAVCKLSVCLSFCRSNCWKLCLQHTAATPESSYVPVSLSSTTKFVTENFK